MTPVEKVRQNGYAISYLTPEQRTAAVCLAAVKQNGDAIHYLTAEQRTAAVCLAADFKVGLASDGIYTLSRNALGRYNAGCRVNLTLAQAKKHWGAPRTDERAKLFLAALEKETGQ
ncbi:MAG: DUF4116 domain-containing protein [Casimicrobium sp.]